MKRLFSFFILIGIMVWGTAAPVDLSRARELLLTFWNQSGCAARSGNSSTDFREVASQAGFQHLYIFDNAAGTGFVVMSADDIAHPVLAYSENGHFDPVAIPENVAGWLGGYDRTIGAAIDAQMEASPEVVAEWTILSSGNVPSPKSTTAVSPLLSTTWDQGSPYNAQCPGSGYNRAPAGCVATAISQVMKFWSYPTKGMGSHSYTCSYYSQTLSANFGTTTYNWSGMPNSVYSSNASVATLLFHCGVATEMNYTPSGSGAQMIAYYDYANDYSAETALKKFFGYSSSIHGERKAAYTDEEWIAMLKADLDAGRPIPYSGFDTDNAGHAFVCDGYNNNNQFHFNWGWSGSYDGYFSINALTPGSGGWGGGSGNYTYNQCAIFGMEPPQLRAVSHTSTNMTASNGGYIVEHGTPLTFSVNIKAASAFNGTLRLQIVELNASTLVQNIGEPVSITVGANQTASKTFSTDVVTAYPGDYLLRLQYQPAGSSTWTMVGIEGCAVPANLTVVLNPDSYEDNNTMGTAYTLPISFSQNHAVVQTTGSNFHSSDDTYDYYKFELPSGYSYRVNARVHDAVSSGNGRLYTANVRFNLSVNNSSWGSLIDDVAPERELADGGPVVFKVRAENAQPVGTYLLDIVVDRSPNTGISEKDGSPLCTLYPNPATNVLYGEVGQNNIAGNSYFQILDVFGRVVRQESVNSENFQIDVKSLDSGLYFGRLIVDGQIIATKKFVKR